MLKRSIKNVTKLTLQDLDPAKISTRKHDMEKAFNVKLLKQYCKSQNLMSNGNKSELIDRIRQSWGLLNSPKYSILLDKRQHYFLEKSSVLDQVKRIFGSKISLQQNELQFEGEDTQQVEAAVSTIKDILSLYTIKYFKYKAENEHLRSIQKLLCTENMFYDQVAWTLKVHGLNQQAVENFARDAQALVTNARVQPRLYIPQYSEAIPIYDHSFPRWTRNLKVFRPYVEQMTSQPFVNVDIQNQKDSVVVQLGTVGLYNVDVGKGQELSSDYLSLFVSKLIPYQAFAQEMPVPTVKRAYVQHIQKRDIIQAKLPSIRRYELVEGSDFYKCSNYTETINARQVTDGPIDLQLCQRKEVYDNGQYVLDDLKAHRHLLPEQQCILQYYEVRYIYDLMGYQLVQVEMKSQDTDVKRFSEIQCQTKKLPEVLALLQGIKFS